SHGDIQHASGPEAMATPTSRHPSQGQRLTSQAGVMKSIRFCVAIGLIALCTGCGLMDSGTSTSSNNGNGSGGGSTNTPPPPPPPPGTGSVDQIKHVVWMLQENRSFDHYFGKLNDYRQSKGLGADVDGLPADASNPSVDNT